MSPFGELWQVVSELFFPPQCVACERPGARFCSACRARVQRFGPPRCPRCDMSHATQAPCPTCRRARSPLAGMRVVGPHEEPLRAAIHALKYENGGALGPLLGELLVERWAAAEIEVDAIVPVPLHPERQRERGYNQSTLLATALVTSLGLPLCEPVLERVRATPPQVGLDRSARQQNVARAFRAQREAAGRRWLLIDDVCTTGATLGACAAALSEAGATEVWALVLARPTLPAPPTSLPTV